MQVIIHTSVAKSDKDFQTLGVEWDGNAVQPPFLFRFEKRAEGLAFLAKRYAPALVHPEAECGQFHEDLWMYDTAEFFLSTLACDRYLEFNLNPTGAWWCRVFGAARIPHEEFVDFHPAVQAKGVCSSAAWECEALLPYAALAELGMDLENCRLAATAILQSPEQIFLTTALDISGEPDFHRPTAWETVSLA